MNAGRIATVAVVLAVAGVAAASLVDSGRAGPDPADTAPPPTSATTPTPDPAVAVGSLSERLERLPLLAPGALGGRIHRRLPACRWQATDLATGADSDLTPPGRCPLWLPGWRYAFVFSVEQSANAPIVRGVDVFRGPRQEGRIELPHEPTGGAAATPAGPLRAVPPRRRAGDAACTVAPGSSQRVPACGPVAFGEEFLFHDGARFRDADGRVVLDFGDPQLYVQPAVNGLVVVAANGAVSVYRGRQRIRRFPLPDGVAASNVVDSDASDEGRTVVLRVHAVSAADIVVFRAGTDDGRADADRHGADGPDGAGRAVARRGHRRRARGAGRGDAGAGGAPGDRAGGGAGGLDARSRRRRAADNPASVRAISSQCGFTPDH